MAKVAFSKLGLAQNKTVKSLLCGNQEIEVKQYLPVNEKLQLIANVINQSADENNFANPLKVSVFTVIEIVEAYTNISFTAKQKEDPSKLYDLLVGDGVSTFILKAIPEAELAELLTAIDDTINNYYAQRNSVLGVLTAINQDYSNINFDLENIQKILSDPNSVGLLRDISPLLNEKTED